MQKLSVAINSEYIALCDLLKVVSIADSGGQAKAMIAAGGVFVDGEEEFRKTRKIRVGQIVKFQDFEIEIEADTEADEAN